MQYIPLEIPNVVRIELDRAEDERGFFARVFCQDEMESHHVPMTVAQCNNSLTTAAGTIRGMHFQHPPMAESKMVRCLRGAVFDVAVDLRAGSDTFGKWCAAELSEDNRSMMYIPEGFAHGFQTLRPNTELLYFHSQFYSRGHEGGVDPLDPDLGIAWPLPVFTRSLRDVQHPKLFNLRPIET